MKELLDWKLFIGMFEIAREEFDGTHKIAEVLDQHGTLNYYAELLNVDCSKPRKYKFLNEMVRAGVLQRSGDVKWGTKDLVAYKINSKKLYDLFLSTDMGRKAYEVFNQFNLMF